MQYNVIEESPVKRKIEVTVPVDEVHAALAATIALYRRSVNIDGFRKGHVPSSVIESRFKTQIVSEATTDLVNYHLNEILSEIKISPLSRIDVDSGSLVKGEEFKYSFSFEIAPVIDIPNYRNVPVKMEKVEVAGTEVDQVIERIRNNMAEAAPIEEIRKAQDGDIAVVDFKGWDESGAPMENVSAENFELPLGEGQAMEEFEALVKKLAPGETLEDKLVFPADFINPALAGKTATMSVTLRAIKAKVLPELDDEFAKKAAGVDTVPALREMIEKSYLETRRQVAKSAAQKRLLDELAGKVEFPLPPSMVEEQIDRAIAEQRERLERKGKSLESTGLTEEKAREMARPKAEEIVKYQLFLLAVAAREDMKVDEPEMDAFFRQMAARANKDWREIRHMHEENNLMHAVKDRILADKAMELIFAQAAVEEVAAAELPADPQAAE